MPNKIALITGGAGSERPISLRSAKNVEAILNKIDSCDVFDYPADWPRFVAEHKNYRLAVPLIHGEGGEDGQVQTLLEDLSVPYLFSGPQSHLAAFDKEIAKNLVSGEINVPAGIVVSGTAGLKFPVPAIVKPAKAGSSIGVTIVREESQLAPAVAEALKYSNSVLIEEYIDGDEYTVGVVESGGETIALPVIAIRPKDKFFDFESKYNQATLAEEICPAPISDELADQLQMMAKSAHEILGIRHLSRSDFMVDKSGKAYFLELNSIPGMTDTSLIPKAVGVWGGTVEELFREWISGKNVL